ncbi:MAG TPA: glycosyltransferase family 39 protein [Candidatus Woesebacteria bacterium]|nr:glycosyltransferase family 39 protein [Candidatus Woesebacteria bacterium]
MTAQNDKTDNSNHLSFLSYLKTHPISALLFGMLLAITAYIAFYQLGAGYFENWDEAWYADVTRNMLERRDPIVLYWNGKVFLDKTPLNFWFNSLAAMVLGLNEFSMRLTSAISGFAAIVIVTAYALCRWGWLAGFAAWSALALNNLFVWRTRTGNLDALVSLLILLTYFVMVSKNKWRLPILGLLFGLIYLQKASLVGYPLAVFVVHEIVFQWRNILKNIPGYIACAAIGGGIVGAWLHLGSMQVGPEFANYYLYRADQGVADIGLQFLNSNYFWHTYYSLQRRIFYLFVAGIIFLGVGLKKHENFALGAFALALLAQLSLTQKDNNWYLVASMPFWGLVVGYGIHGIFSVVKRFTANPRYILVAQIVALIPILYVSYKTFTVNIQAIIATRANEAEVTSALKIKELSKLDEKILRLDFSYPVTIYYANRVTEYHTTIDDGALASVINNNISWVVGKEEQVRKFLQLYGKEPKRVIPSGEEAIVQL